MNFNTSFNRSARNIHIFFWSNLSFGFVGLFLNAGVCLIISTHSVLRQPFNYLILNLSLSDILVSCAVILNGILDYSNAKHHISYRVSSIICHINVAFLAASLPAACLTLLVISIERYQAIAVVRLRNLQLSTVRKVIAIIWLVTIMTAIIPIVYAKLNFYYPYECGMGIIGHFQILIILLFSLITTAVLPIGIMLIIYVIILYKLISELPIVQPTLSVVRNRREKQLRRSILPVLCISIFSAASSIPYLLLNYYSSFNRYYDSSFRVPFIMRYYQLWIAAGTLFILTPVINPLLYNLASSKFREVLYSLTCDRCISVVQEAPSPIKAIRVQTENRKSSTSHSRIHSVHPQSTNESTVQ